MHDPGLAAKLDAIADLEGLLVTQVAGRDQLVAAPQFVATADPSHRDQGRYAEWNPDIPSVLEKAVILDASSGRVEQTFGLSTAWRWRRGAPGGS